MKMQEIKMKAKLLGLSSGRMRKTELIRTIQMTEGNSACFQTGQERCDQYECCWREDCVAD